MNIPEQRKVCFGISEELDKRVKNLPRSFNLSERMRQALDKILDEYDRSYERQLKILTDKDRVVAVGAK
jgi:hypothetical protein